jgi:hypothetical protein
LDLFDALLDDPRLHFRMLLEPGETETPCSVQKRTFFYCCALCFAKTGSGQQKKL